MCNKAVVTEFKVLYGIFPGHVVAQLVKALCYKPESRRFDSRFGGFFN
jgi:hypothetical protein